jgi:hypothetical protein
VPLLDQPQPRAARPLVKERRQPPRAADARQRPDRLQKGPRRNRHTPTGLGPKAEPRDRAGPTVPIRRNRKQSPTADHPTPHPPRQQRYHRRHSGESQPGPCERRALVGGGRVLRPNRTRGSRADRLDALEPVLRSRGAVREAARALADDDAFRTRMHRLLTAEPSGRLAVPSLDSMVERVRRGASGASPRAARVSGSAGRRRPDHRLVGPPPAAMAASRLQPATTTPPPQPATAARSVSPM